MPKTFAVLGATGQTGAHLVRNLLDTDHHINVYARSRARLEAKLPGIDHAANVTVFIGALSDTATLTACLADADVVLSTVAQNQNEPDCSIAQQTALAILKALEPRRASTNVPTLVFLASLALHPSFKENQSIFDRLLHWTNYHVYTDCERANELLLSNDWLPTVFACPAGLLHSDAHTVELVDSPTEASQLLSYADLARGMIMMGEAGVKPHGRYVLIKVNEGKPIRGNPAALMRYLLPNVLAMLCPPLWRLGRDWWP